MDSDTAQAIEALEKRVAAIEQRERDREERARENRERVAALVDAGKGSRWRVASPPPEDASGLPS